MTPPQDPLRTALWCPSGCYRDPGHEGEHRYADIPLAALPPRQDEPGPVDVAPGGHALLLEAMEWIAMVAVVGAKAEDAASWLQEHDDGRGDWVFLAALRAAHAEPETAEHPGEGREDGWEELRREIEALPRLAATGPDEMDGAFGTQPDGRYLDRAAVLAIVDRLAAARGEPGLDVERLARAFDRIDKGIETRYPGATETSRQRAALIAVEYDRLKP